MKDAEEAMGASWRAYAATRTHCWFSSDCAARRGRRSGGQRHTDGILPTQRGLLTSSKLTSLVEVWEPVAMVPEVMAFVVMSRRWSVGMIQ